MEDVGYTQTITCICAILLTFLIDLRAPQIFFILKARISHEADEPTFRHIVCTGYDNMTTILRRLCQEISKDFNLPYDPVYDY